MASLREYRTAGPRAPEKTNYPTLQGTGQSMNRQDTKAPSILCVLVSSWCKSSTLLVCWIHSLRVPRKAKGGHFPISGKGWSENEELFGVRRHDAALFCARSRWWKASVGLEMRPALRSSKAAWCRRTPNLASLLTISEGQGLDRGSGKST